jgi:hypothetical protein
VIVSVVEAALILIFLVPRWRRRAPRRVATA